MPRKRRRTTTTRRRSTAATKRATTTRRRRRKKPLAKKVATAFRGVELHLSKEIIGIMYMVLFAFTISARQGAAGPFGQYWDQFFTSTFGYSGTYIVIALMGIYAISAFISRDRSYFTRWFGALVLVLSLLGLLQVVAGIDSYSLTEESLKLHGGYVGFVVGMMIQSAFGGAARFILAATFLIGLILSFEISLRELFDFVRGLFYEEDADLASKPTSKKDVADAILEKLNAAKGKKGVVVEDDLRVVKPTRAKKKEEDFKVVTPKKALTVKDALPIQQTIDENYKWEFPSVDLLDEAEQEVEFDDKFLRTNAKKIKAKLEQFGIRVKVKDVKVGPTVMQYSLDPAEDVKLSKITSLGDDLKLALAAESLRIEAPIPGKSLVGIEIPNETRINVKMKEMLLSDAFYKVSSNLRLPLGKGVSGKPHVEDLSKMPHLLIAGQTGSGKSICINSMIVSLLYQNSPRDLRLILIDPKRVELKVYNHIPHLLTPVITEVNKAINALKWLVTEMMHRYTLLEEVGARNREEYNAKVDQEKKLPQIVCVIDELAELMMTGDKKSIEGYICRIAQLARAVGIHLIVATQRPSVDVITGLIKANIPARIAFRVASSVDSRTILDMTGAEDLLGRGDMLYIPGDVSEPVRIQGVFIPTHEIEKVINSIKLTPQEVEEITYVEDITKPSSESPLKGTIFEGKGGKASDDDLFEEAIAILRSAGKASTSFLQRRLKIGYSRAARLLDDLEEAGIVGPAEGSKPRKVFLEAMPSE